ncbi:protein snakeskin-like [Teleopsis dalmanni]|nr:protein snakeskin-like [Teleopsis dalmanni]
MIVCGTVAGFTIICAVLFIGHILDSQVEKRMNALFSIVGCVLFIISGILVIEQWQDDKWFGFNKENRRYALAAGSLMIINGVIFLLDAICIFRS